MDVASSRPDHLPTLSTAKASKLSPLVKSLLVAERPMPALLLRLLLQCAGDTKMNPGPVSPPTPTNCLQLMQWNAIGISGKITELLTFLHSNDINIAAIQEIKNKGGGLLMLIKDTIPFVDNTVALPQSADPHLEQQCPIANNCTSTTSTFHHVAVVALVTTHRSRTSSAAAKCRLLLGILMCFTPDWI